ncbi:MAG TPA: LytR C-terminal domain-containing protein [Gemmatimonadales bacterium]|nr:LytR C-terminal domain-containing protein [Gemmatimonadales bacterium]
MELTAPSRRWLIAGGILLGLALLVLAGRAFRRDRVEGHAYDIPSTEDRIVVEVLNGSGRTGLGRLGTRRLRRMGIDVVFFGTIESRVDSTMVIARRGNRKQAEAVREALGVGQVGLEQDTLRRVDVSVILGRDYQPDEEGRP